MKITKTHTQTKLLIVLYQQQLISAPQQFSQRNAIRLPQAGPSRCK